MNRDQEHANVVRMEFSYDIDDTDDVDAWNRIIAHEFFRGFRNGTVTGLVIGLVLGLGLGWCLL